MGKRFRMIVGEASNVRNKRRRDTDERITGKHFVFNSGNFNSC